MPALDRKRLPGGKDPERLAVLSRIVIVATHWLGDTFWALQVVPFLEHRFPSAEIHVIVRPGQAWLARLWVSAERVHSAKSLSSDRRREGLPRPWSLLQEARAIRSQVGSIDLAVDLTNTLLSAFFVRLLRPGRSLGAGSRRITSWLYDTWQPLDRFGGHLARKPWWVLDPLFAESDGWPSADAQLRPRIPPARTGQETTGTAAARAAEDFRPRGHAVAGEHVPGMILLFPGAGWPQKRWPLDRFVALGELLQNAGRSAAMLFAAEEHAEVEEARRLQAGDAARGAGGVAADLRVDVRVPDGPELLDLLSRAAGVVANDSGPAHLAAALEIPTVAVFGPTNPGICGPLGARVRVVRTDCPDRPEAFQHHCHDVPAYPCDLDGLRSVGVDRVGEALQVLLAEGEGAVPGAGWHAARSAKNDASRTME